MIVRPYGVVLRGRLELGLELLMYGSDVVEIRPHTGIPEPYVVSPAFVNAHSHFEYLGLQNEIQAEEYWPWIRELTQRKMDQTLPEVRSDCIRAAEENRAAGIAVVAEHSDRPFAGEAMARAGLSGVIFQEVITFFEREAREAKLSKVGDAALENRQFFPSVFLSPHAPYTVHATTLRELGATKDPISIHVAETLHEEEFYREGRGAIADFYQRFGNPFEVQGMSPVEYCDELGLLREGTQLVHCCAVSRSDISLMAERGVGVAHCPRSNTRLKCPTAPVREMLDVGIPVGLGLDSAASSGPIDLFAEMREALRVSQERSRSLAAEEVWEMASLDARRWPLPMPRPWETIESSGMPLIKIHVQDASCTEDLIEGGRPELVEWL